MVQPPPQINALGTLSSLYGLQQQKLGIQQQQQAVAGQTAETAQLQQKNQELQGLAQFSKNAMQDPKYRNPDGSLNTQAFQDGATAVAPTYGQPYIGQITSNAKEGVLTQQAVQQLSSDQNQTITNGLKGLANIPGGATKSNVLDWIDQVEAMNPNPSMRRAMNNLLTTMQPDQNGGYSQSAAKAAAYMGGISMQAPGTVGVGGGTLPVTTTTMGPNVGQVTPTGAAIPNILGPTDQPAYKAAVAAAQAGASTRASGVGTIDVQRANQVSTNIQPSTAGIQLSQSVDDLADQIHSGKFVAGISQAAAAVGMSSATYGRQLLAKDLGQLKTLAIKNAPSDQAAGTIQSGYPEVTSDPQTIHTAMDYIRGSFRQNVARGQLLSTYRQNHPDLTGFQNADDAYTSSVNPLMAEFKSLKSPQQRIGFYQRNFKSPAEAEAFKNQVQGVSSGP